VRIPHEAYDALARFAIDNGISRDAAARLVLGSYVDEQHQLNEEERHIHLTTVLRWPPLPPGRNRPDPRAHLRLRLEPELQVAASDLGLRLPGQSGRHGHHDYAARTLTDAVMTAIYKAEPFLVAGLEDLPQLLTQRVALGLWRLTVAATLTEAETQALWRSGDPDVAAILGDEDVAWHHPWRFDVAHHLLKTLLSDEDDAEEWMVMLEDQTQQFQDIVGRLRRRDSDVYWLQGGLERLGEWRGSVKGRGGTAVWRAERKRALSDIERWSTSPESLSEFEVSPPEWPLRWPEEWSKRCFSHGQTVPSALDEYVARGLVTCVRAGSRIAFWPLTESGDPVDRFAACIAAAGHLDPARFAEVVLLDYVELPYPRIPANDACDLGLIDTAARDELIARASSANAAMIKNTLERARRLDSDEYAALKALAHDPQRFVRLARRHHLRCWFTNDSWTWRIRAVVEAFRSGQSSARIQSLTTALTSTTGRQVEMSMQRAWHRAFWLGYEEPDDHL
jgi:hypothetical protein